MGQDEKGNDLGTAKTIRFTAVNVQIVNGLGATNGYPTAPNSMNPVLTSTNGLENLIAGYNELRSSAPNDRTGSHNILAGVFGNYPNFRGLIAGSTNEITGPLSSVTGGQDNTAAGRWASVTGGESNSAAGDYSSVSGGRIDNAGGDYSSVSGGQSNTASGRFSTISGGRSIYCRGGCDYLFSFRQLVGVLLARRNDHGFFELILLGIADLLIGEA